MEAEVLGKQVGGVSQNILNASSSNLWGAEANCSRIAVLSKGSQKSTAGR